MANQIVVSGVAGADLTAAQGLAVYADGSDSEKIKICTDDELTTVLGILLNAPADDELAEICVFGECEAVAGAAVEPFDHLMVDGSGKLIAHTGASNVAFARYIPGVKASPTGALSQPDGADTRTIKVFVTGQLRVNPAA